MKQIIELPKNRYCDIYAYLKQVKGHKYCLETNADYISVRYTDEAKSEICFIDVQGGEPIMIGGKIDKKTVHSVTWDEGLKKYIICFEKRGKV